MHFWLFLAVIQAEEVQQSVEHSPHTVGGLLYALKEMHIVPIAALFLQQFGIACYCRQRCTQLVGNSLYRFLSGGYEYLILLHGLFQLPYQIRCLALVLFDTICITVYDNIGDD